MYWLSAMYMRIRGWKVVGDLPEDRKFVALGAPHTSNLDFLIFLGVLRHFNRRARFIGKKSLFVGPFGWIMRRLGGIPVDRTRPEGLVGQVVAAFDAADEMILVIAPEGTRSRSEGWKSGFYRIAQAAGVPIVPAAVEGPKRTATVGPAFHPTGDLEADFEILREFYAGRIGIRPGNETPVVPTL